MKKNTKVEKVFDSLFGEMTFEQIPYTTPLDYINKYWTEFSKISKPSNSLIGNMWECVVNTLLYREGLLPFYRQAKVSFVPNVNFDILLYTPSFPINISLKTSLRERYKPISENKTIYVKNIPKRVKDVEELKKIFGKFGKITWGDLYQDKEDRQFAILDFDTSEAARKAKEELGDKKLEDSDESGLYVDFLQKRSERRRMLTSKIGDINTKLNEENKNCNLYIKNLPYDLTEEKLKEIFSKCGEIKSSKIGKYILVTKVQGDFKNIVTSKGYGFVCYTKEEDAKKAMMNSMEKFYQDMKRPNALQ